MREKLRERDCKRKRASERNRKKREGEISIVYVSVRERHRAVG